MLGAIKKQDITSTVSYFIVLKDKKKPYSDEILLIIRQPKKQLLKH